MGTGRRACHAMALCLVPPTSLHRPASTSLQTCSPRRCPFPFGSSLAGHDDRPQGANVLSLHHGGQYNYSTNYAVVARPVPGRRRVCFAVRLSVSPSLRLSYFRFLFPSHPYSIHASPITSSKVTSTSVSEADRGHQPRTSTWNKRKAEIHRHEGTTMVPEPNKGFPVVLWN